MALIKQEQWWFYKKFKMQTKNPFKEKRTIISLIFLFVGFFLVINSRENITGAFVGVSATPGVNSIFGFIFVIFSFIFFICGKDLEKIIANIGVSAKDREEFIDKHYKEFREQLEREGEIPRKLKQEEEKDNYAKQRLLEMTDPITGYNNKNAIEFIKYFRRSPGNINRVPLKARINWKIGDPFLLRETKKYSKDNQIWNAANRKLYHLCETGSLGTHGNTYEFVPDTGGAYVYLKDIASGARVFLKKISDSEYDLIAIVGGQQKKRDEIKVIQRCKDLYDKEQRKSK
jgi:hypothetical protein